MQHTSADLTTKGIHRGLLVRETYNIISPGQGVRKGCSRLLQGTVDKHLIQSVPTAYVHVGFERLEELCQLRVSTYRMTRWVNT